MKNILIVDDDHGIGSALSSFLQKKQYFTEKASSGSIAINKALTYIKVNDVIKYVF